jgi:2,4-dienoyl-CoA reductase-like NADH-dependent reductase (Old Yellow Enzyme family)
MRILVRGCGSDAYLFGHLAAAGGADVTIDDSASDAASNVGVFLDAVQLEVLARARPMLRDIMAEHGHMSHAQEIRRAGEATTIATGGLAAIPERVLAARLREAASGCRFASVSHDAETSYDLVVLSDDAGRLAEHGEIETEEGGTHILVGVSNLALRHPVVSVREMDGLWMQAILLPQTVDKTLVIIEAPERPSSIEVFAEELAGRDLNIVSDWHILSFLRARRRVMGRHVLIGRAAARGHYGLLADVRLALEDAMALWESLAAKTPDPLADYQDRRAKAGDRLLRASRLASAWCCDLPMRRKHPQPQFAFSYLTRHHRVSYEKIKAHDPGFVRAVERSIAPAAEEDEPIPPMFRPLRLRDLTLDNRIVFSPMCMRQGTAEAMPTDFHLVHLGSRAMGGAGLVFAEMTAIMPTGRISENCVGIYSDEHVGAWRRVTNFIHEQSDAKIAMQLGHAGRKGSTRPTADSWNVPLEEGGWELLSASAIPYTPRTRTPRAVTRDDMDEIVQAYVAATRRSLAAGFDLIEVHMAHGYLLSSFISPLTNLRDDAYGGPIEARMRFPLEVFRAVRATWPAEKPVSVRISACDWRPDGISIDEVIALARMLKEAGCDIITVSTGNTTSGIGQGPSDGRLFQLPFSDRVRNEVGIPTITVGNVRSWGDANAVIAAGRADLCAIARGHLFNPYFTRHAAQAQAYPLRWPSSYRSAAQYTPVHAEKATGRSATRRESSQSAARLKQRNAANAGPQGRSGAKTT